VSLDSNLVEEITVVLRGMLQVEHAGIIDVRAGQRS
jgi:hypothetical protein